MFHITSGQAPTRICMRAGAYYCSTAYGSDARAFVVPSELPFKITTLPLPRTLAHGFYFTPEAAIPSPETKPSEKPGENDG